MMRLLPLVLEPSPKKFNCHRDLERRIEVSHSHKYWERSSLFTHDTFDHEEESDEKEEKQKEKNKSITFKISKSNKKIEDDSDDEDDRKR
jgi:hypothetical protein